MALVARGTKEDEEFFNFLAQNLSFWQTSLLLLWSPHIIVIALPSKQHKAKIQHQLEMLL